MANTPNFNWNTPNDTDLVKDGAAAIRTLGNNIDASLVDLKGGTTGQVLAKASNADLDYTWSNVDPLTILDAKGDLITATAADTPARLAVGSNNQVLLADSTTATGLRWGTPPSGSLTLLSTTTLSGSTTSISSINQSYTHLYIQMENAGMQTTGGTINIQVNGVTNNQRNIVYSNVDATQLSSSGDWKLAQARVISTGQNENVAAIWIYNYANTDTHKVASWTSSWHDSLGGAYVVGFGHALSSTTSAITSLSFVTGATFSGGTIKIYGVN